MTNTQRLRWWWYDLFDYRLQQGFHSRVTCRLLNHKWQQKMSGNVCRRCSTFQR